jgi:hypothetical protein
MPEFCVNCNEFLSQWPSFSGVIWFLSMFHPVSWTKSTHVIKTAAEHISTLRHITTPEPWCCSQQQNTSLHSEVMTNVLYMYIWMIVCLSGWAIIHYIWMDHVPGFWNREDKEGLITVENYIHILQRQEWLNLQSGKHVNNINTMFQHSF